MNIEYIVISAASVFIIMLCIILILSIKMLRLRKKIKTLSIAYSKINKIIESQKNLSDDDIHKENFIKFLSDSRDWAFKYIEDVQSGLNKFVSNVDPLIEYFDYYGDTLSINRPDYDSMKTISTSYKELKKLLPEEEVK